MFSKIPVVKSPIKILSPTGINELGKNGKANKQIKYKTATEPLKKIPGLFLCLLKKTNKLKNTPVATKERIAKMRCKAAIMVTCEPVPVGKTPIKKLCNKAN
jgi:hypothetical protein